LDRGLIATITSCYVELLTVIRCNLHVVSGIELTVKSSTWTCFRRTPRTIVLIISTRCVGNIHYLAAFRLASHQAPHDGSLMSLGVVHQFDRGL
jgi:hypothetical protein